MENDNFLQLSALRPTRVKASDKGTFIMYAWGEAGKKGDKGGGIMRKV